MTTATDAFVGNVFLYRGDGGSPEVFTAVCQVFGISGLGEANEQIDATTFCSRGVKEYIAGLADGTEFNLEMNFIAKSGADRDIQLAMIDDVKQKRVRSFELRCDGDNDGIIDLTFHLRATCLSWTLNPNPAAKNTISFGQKISGSIDITTP